MDGEEYVLIPPPNTIADEWAVPVDFLTGILPSLVGKQINLDREDWVLQITGEPFVEGNESKVEPCIPSETVSTGFRVIIDPGHGGYDAGARSKDGLLEKNLTLKVAQRMKEALAAEEGVDVHLTRNGDDSMTPAQRANFANRLRGHAYISIHFNSSPAQRSRGFRTYVNSSRMRLGTDSLEADMFSRAKPAADSSEAYLFLSQSKRLAEEIADRLRDLQLTGGRDKEAFLAVMDDLSMPGVLVEILHLSNPEDLVILSKRDFIDSVSRSLCNSIMAFRNVLVDESALRITR